MNPKLEQTIETTAHTPTNHTHTHFNFIRSLPPYPALSYHTSIYFTRAFLPYSSQNELLYRVEKQKYKKRAENREILLQPMTQYKFDNLIYESCNQEQRSATTSPQLYSSNHALQYISPFRQPKEPTEPSKLTTA